MASAIKATIRRAWGLTRVSTTGQAESGLGLSAQRRAIEDAARRLGLELVQVFEDAGLSGGLELEERPGLLAAIGALGRGDTLIVAKRDRLGRDPIVLAMVERLVTRRGARVVSALEEATNGDDPSNVLMRRMLDAFAEFERLIGKARTKAALRAKRARGERAGNVPWGFRATPDGKLIEDAREREVLDLIRRLRARGQSYAKIAASLRRRGVPNRRGSTRWLAPRIRALVLAAERAA